MAAGVIELIELLERSNSVTFSKYFLLLNNEWIKDWTENRRMQQCVNISRYFCEIGGKLVKIDDASKSDICQPERSYLSIYLSISLSILSIFILAATSTLYLNP
jgi:hypothetical protein